MKPVLLQLISDYKSYLSAKATSTKPELIDKTPKLFEFVKSVKEMARNGKITETFTNQWMKSIQNGDYLLGDSDSLKLIKLATSIYAPDTSNTAVKTNLSPFLPKPLLNIPRPETIILPN